MKTYLTALAAAAFASASVWIYHSTTRPAPVAPPPVPATVPAPQAPQPIRTSPANGGELEGRIEAGSEVEIRTPLRGYPVRLKVAAGDFVQKGQLLAELGDPKLEESVRDAEAGLRVVKAGIQAREAHSAENKADPPSALGSTKAGTLALLHGNSPPSPHANAEEDLDRGRLTQAEAAVARARLVLAETRIVSPISGYVVRGQADGELSQPDAVLVQVVDIATVKTVIHVGSDMFPRIVTNQEARIAVDALPGRTFVGKVVRKPPAVDLRTREAAVSIEVANSEMLLKPGMYAHVRPMFDQNNEARLAAQPFWLSKSLKGTSGPEHKGANPQGDAELLTSLKGLSLTMSSLAKELESKEKATQVTAEASKEYFQSLEKLIGRLRNQTRPSGKHAGLASTADEIDNLPALHVDEELLTFGADVSKALRQMAEQRRSLEQASVVGDWNLVEQTGRASGAVKAQGLLRINMALADIRRKMTRRYNLEFLATAEHAPPSRAERGRARH